MEGEREWGIDPKVWQERTFKTEYSNRIGDTAPNFFYQKIRPPDKNKSHSLTAGAVPFPPKEQFTTLYAKEMLLNKTAGQPGYEKRESCRPKGVQVQLGRDNLLHVTQSSSHEMLREPDMRAANVRNMRTDGMVSAGLPSTNLPHYNIVPGVGNEDPSRGRCVFDAFTDHSNKFRDTRRFAKMNNPRIPRDHAYNPLTGDIAPAKKPPPVELYPRNPTRPPLASLGQVRPPESDAFHASQGSSAQGTHVSRAYPWLPQWRSTLDR